MAEILLSLTIIGVVAAITLPSLTGNINERTWNTQRKALYARMSQAIALMPSLNGYGTLTEDDDGKITADTATETFITEGLSKVLKINNICDNEHLADCGIVSSMTTMKGSLIETPNTLYMLDSGFKSAAFEDLSTYSTLDTKAAAFETQNGESIITYYNQNCRADTLDFGKTSSGGILIYTQPTMCVNFIYDLNGNKGPNTVGKDIGFITVFNSTDAYVVAPMPSATTSIESTDFNNASKACTNQAPDSRLPNREELGAMSINQALIDLPHSGYWSSSLYSADNAVWTLYSETIGYWYAGNKGYPRDVRCVKR